MVFGWSALDRKLLPEVVFVSLESVDLRESQMLSASRSSESFGLKCYT